jgi:hypothetical protein
MHIYFRYITNRKLVFHVRAQELELIADARPNCCHEDLQTKTDLVVNGKVLTLVSETLADEVEQDLLRRVVRGLVLDCEGEVEFAVRTGLEDDIRSMSTAKVSVVDGVRDLQKTISVDV